MLETSLPRWIWLLARGRKSKPRFWLGRHSTELIIILVVVGISTAISYLFIRARPTVYAVAFSDKAVKINLPSNYVAHFWIENGEPWAAITISDKILDEWQLELGYHWGDVNGWKEEWRIWVDNLQLHSDHCWVRFRFKDVHYL